MTAEQLDTYISALEDDRITDEVEELQYQREIKADGRSFLSADRGQRIELGTSFRSC